MLLPERPDRYVGNDFSGARLKGVAFMGGVDLTRQTLPEGEGHLLLDDAERVVSVALAQVYSWPESAEKKEARVKLEISLHDYIRQGQRQLFFSPHDMTSRLTEMVRTLDQLPEPELAAAYEEAERRSVRGYPCTYFRAASAEQDRVDRVDAVGVEPSRALGRLIALIGDVPWTFETVPFELLWPRKGKRDAVVWLVAEGLVEDYWLKSSEPALQELGASVRDALADVDDDRLPELAARWARGAELSQYNDSTPASILDLLVQLVALARRARDNGDSLYCRTGSPIPGP